MPDAQDDEDAPADDSVRYLARRKANYAANDVRRLRFQDGVLVPDSTTTRRSNVSGEFVSDIVRRAVTTLAASNIHGTRSTSSPNYLPKLAQQYGLLEESTKAQFATAMRTLVLSGELSIEVVGTYPGNRTKREGLVLKVPK